MMKTKIKRNFTKTPLKLLSYGLVVALMVFIGSFNNSLSAQTNVWLGETASSEVKSMIEAEQEFLEREIKNPAQSADTEMNADLIEAYDMVRRSFNKGSSLKKAMIAMLDGKLFTDADNGSSVAKFDLTPAQEQKLEDIKSYINSWNVTSRNLEPIEDAFQQIRELKNQ